MSNVFSFTGTVGRDAEVRYAPSGVAILNVAVANNIGFGDKQQTLWVRVVVFGKRAEGKLVDYLKKGTQVFVSGELTQSEYKANDGTTKTSLELNATVVDLIGKKSEGEQQAPQQQRQQPQQRPTQAPANDLPYDDNLDIPF
jgi:single-strand DNA-binding protein